nr:MAG TPA: hypothetical protein [Caudoviricetes sp.]
MVYSQIILFIYHLYEIKYEGGFPYGSLSNTL